MVSMNPISFTLPFAGVVIAFAAFAVFAFLKGKEERFNKALKRLSMHFSLPFRKEKTRAFFLTLAALDGSIEEKRVKVRAVAEQGFHTLVSVSMRAVLPNPIKVTRAQGGLQVETQDRERAESILNPKLKQKLLALKSKAFLLHITPGRVLFKVEGIETSFRELKEITELCISLAEGAESS